MALALVDGILGHVNPTFMRMDFQRDRWYRVRLRVTQARIEAWIDDKKVITIETAARRFTLDGRDEPLRPLGLHSWGSTTALRDIRLRRLGREEDDAGEQRPGEPTRELEPGD